MNLTVSGLTVTIPDAELQRLVLERLRDNTMRVAFAPSSPPRIGAEWPGQGGIYAGLCAGRDGGNDYHLILGPEYDGDVDWPASIEWAKGQRVHGFADFALPYRAEQSILFGNLRSHFQERAYWSSEQHASSSDCAWLQYFDDGGQDTWLKDGKLRAQVVRRLPL